MKVGMNLLLWTDTPQPGEHGQLLPRIRDWGFDGVEFPVDGLSAADVASFAAQLDELGLGSTAISALDAQVADPASREPRLRNSAVELLKVAIDNTRLLGAEVLCGPLFQGLGRFSGQGPDADEWAYAVETLRKAGEYAQQAGVTLALEPLNRFEMYLVNTLRDGAHFVREVDLPNVGLLADTHHGNIEENDVALAWREAAPYLCHVHISENDRGVPGHGHAVPAEIFGVLQEIGYNKWVTIEAFNQSVPGLIPRLHIWRAYAQHPEDAARLGIEYIRRFVKAGPERRS